MRISLALLALAVIASSALFFTSANVQYRSAERHFQKGDFEKAEILCEKALQRDPRHAPARALYTEIQFILGRGKATVGSCDYSRYMHRSVIATPLLLAHIDQALHRAEEHRVAGEPEAGITEIRKVLEFIKWLPAGDDLDARRNQAEWLFILLTADD